MQVVYQDKGNEKSENAKAAAGNMILHDETDDWWQWAVDTFYPLASVVVRFDELMKKIFCRRNPVNVLLVGVPLYFILANTIEWVIDTMGVEFGVIFMLIAVISVGSLLLEFYKLLVKIYAHVCKESNVFPANEDTGVPFNEEGVQLSVLFEFVASCGGERALGKMTTTEVCDKFLKPLTNGLKASYCDYLLNKDSADTRVRQANVFISHAWKYEFMHVVDALKLHFENEAPEDVVIWFDLFSNNQHGLLDDPPPFGWWCHTFLNAVRHIGT